MQSSEYFRMKFFFHFTSKSKRHTWIKNKNVRIARFSNKRSNSRTRQGHRTYSRGGSNYSWPRLIFYLQNESSSFIMSQYIPKNVWVSDFKWWMYRLKRKIRPRAFCMSFSWIFYRASLRSFYLKLATICGCSMYFYG